MSKKKSTDAPAPTPAPTPPPSSAPDQLQLGAGNEFDPRAEVELLEAAAHAADFADLRERAALAAMTGLIATMADHDLHRDEIVKLAWIWGEKFAKAKPQ